VELDRDQSLSYLPDTIGFRHSVGQIAQVFAELIRPVFDAVEEIRELT
jgi:hypothetical protein